MHGLTQAEGHQLETEQRQELEEALARRYRAGRFDGGEEDWRIICGHCGTDIHTIRELACRLRAA